MKRRKPIRGEKWREAWARDIRRTAAYLMLVAIVALSFKVHRVYFLRDPDPWLLRPRHFSRRMSPPPPPFRGRPVPYIKRIEPRKSYTACHGPVPWNWNSCLGRRFD
jgi:hypothetical protein